MKYHFYTLQPEEEYMQSKMHGYYYEYIMNNRETPSPEQPTYTYEQDFTQFKTEVHSIFLTCANQLDTLEKSNIPLPLEAQEFHDYLEIICYGTLEYYETLAQFPPMYFSAKKFESDLQFFQEAHLKNLNALHKLAGSYDSKCAEYALRGNIYLESHLCNPDFIHQEL